MRSIWSVWEGFEVEVTVLLDRVIVQITGLLTIDPVKRLQSAECLQHSWMIGMREEVKENEKRDYRKLFRHSVIFIQSVSAPVREVSEPFLPDSYIVWLDSKSTGESWIRTLSESGPSETRR